MEGPAATGTDSGTGSTGDQPPPSPPPAPPGGAPDPGEGGERSRQESPRSVIRARFGSRGFFDKFTERAKKVLVLAQSEAQGLNHNYIGTEHLLLGLLREREGVGSKTLIEAGVVLEEVRRAVEVTIGRGLKPVSGEISLTPRSKQVIELAIRDARWLKHDYVGTEHLLLGLIREGEGVAIGVLDALGVDTDKLRRTVLGTIYAMAQAGGERRSEGAGPRDNVVSCRVDDRDLAAMDMLIETGIRSTRSDAASWLIHAGIEANQALFQRVETTVGEIRRLREAAQAMAHELGTKQMDEAPPSEAAPSSEAAPPTT